MEGRIGNTEENINTQTNGLMQQFDFHEFTDAISSMTELLDHEAELLTQMKMRDVAELQNKKNELSNRLETQKAFLDSKSDALRSLSNTQVDQIRSYSKRFNDSMKAYGNELFKASKVNETIVEMVVDTVKEQVRTKNTYENFHMANSTSREEYMPAIKFNEQI